MVRHVLIANQWQGTYELRIGGQARSLQEFMGSSLLLPNFIASFQIIAVLIIHLCTYSSILYCNVVNNVTFFYLDRQRQDRAQTTFLIKTRHWQG